MKIMLLDLLPYLLSLAITLSLAIFTFRRRGVLGSRSFSILIFIETLETGGFILELVSPSLSGKMFWDNFQWYTALLFPVAMFYFSLEYIGRIKPTVQRWIGLLTFISLGLATMISVDLFPGLGILSPRLIVAKPFSVYTYDFGTIILTAAGYSYVLILAGLFVLLWEFLRQKEIFKQQTLIILIGLSIPVAGTVLSLLGIELLPNRDILPITFPIANIIIIYGLYRYRIFDLVPIARSSVMDYVSDPMAVLDTREIIQEINPAFEEIFKITKREVIQKTIRQFMPAFPPADQPVINQTFREERALEIGKEKFFFDISSKPFNNRLGIYGGRLMIFHNITELKRAEEQLVRQEKLAVLGQLAGGVGHELRNPLSVISNSVYYLKLIQPDPNDKVGKYHSMIEQEVRNATQIVNDLLDFSRIIKSDQKPVTVAELVDETLRRFPLPASIQVSIQLPAGLPKVLIDRYHMQQVLNNLFTNACQAMSNSGSLSISAREVMPSSGPIPGKKMVAMAVNDTGTGISPENMHRLFDPLYTTKINGIGLGLAVSKKLTEADDGWIDVESEVGKGSTFTVYLPVGEGTLEKV